MHAASASALTLFLSLGARIAHAKTAQFPKIPAYTDSEGSKLPSDKNKDYLSPDYASPDWYGWTTGDLTSYSLTLKDGDGAPRGEQVLSQDEMGTYGEFTYKSPAEFKARIDCRYTSGKPSTDCQADCTTTSDVIKADCQLRIDDLKDAGGGWGEPVWKKDVELSYATITIPDDSAV